MLLRKYGSIIVTSMKQTLRSKYRVQHCETLFIKERLLIYCVYHNFSWGWLFTFHPQFRRNKLGRSFITCDRDQDSFRGLVTAKLRFLITIFDALSFHTLFIVPVKSDHLCPQPFDFLLFDLYVIENVLFTTPLNLIRF